MNPVKRGALVALGCLGVALTSSAQTAPDPDWAALAQRVITAISAQHFTEVEARYDAAMKAALPAGKLSSTWETIGQQVGTLRDVSLVNVEAVGPHHVVTLRCQFDKAVLDAKVTFDPEQRLAGLQGAHRRSGPQVD
jgi:hypothetical protein